MSDPFYVRQDRGGDWHVETVSDPEEMECGEKVSVDGEADVTQRRPRRVCARCDEGLSARS
jgi:hypothetical protein